MQTRYGLWSVPGLSVAVAYSKEYGYNERNVKYGQMRDNRAYRYRLLWNVQNLYQGKGEHDYHE